jgi:hypothetical protein
MHPSLPTIAESIVACLTHKRKARRTNGHIHGAFAALFAKNPHHLNHFITRATPPHGMLVMNISLFSDVPRIWPNEVFLPGRKERRIAAIFRSKSHLLCSA